jgi:hypothetical protein
MPQLTNKTATSNISSDGDGSISNHYWVYNPGGNRLNNTIEGTPTCDEGNSMHVMKVTTHARRRQQHACNKGNNTHTMKAKIRAQQRQ